MSYLTKSEAKAVMIAVDELRSYCETIGDEDERHAIQLWAVRKLDTLLIKAGYPEWVSHPGHAQAPL